MQRCRPSPTLASRRSGRGRRRMPPPSGTACSRSMQAQRCDCGQQYDACDERRPKEVRRGSNASQCIKQRNEAGHRDGFRCYPEGNSGNRQCQGGAQHLRTGDQERSDNLLPVPTAASAEMVLLDQVACQRVALVVRCKMSQQPGRNGRRGTLSHTSSPFHEDSPLDSRIRVPYAARASFSPAAVGVK